MFRKIITVTAALALGAGAVFGGVTTASAISYEEGPCVTATLKSDPSIFSQRGNCAGVPTPEPVEENVTVYSTLIRVQTVTSDPDSIVSYFTSLPYTVELFNADTGALISQVKGTSDRTGLAFSEPLTDTTNTPPNYILSVTHSGSTYTTTYGPNDFVKDESGNWRIEAMVMHSKIDVGVGPENEWVTDFGWDEQAWMAGWN